jgi:hypothetical protein
VFLSLCYVALRWVLQLAAPHRYNRRSSTTQSKDEGAEEQGRLDRIAAPFVRSVDIPSTLIVAHTGGRDGSTHEPGWARDVLKSGNIHRTLAPQFGRPISWAPGEWMEKLVVCGR